ncbi:hypothetical protein EDD11_003085 [Mortierella claussenii]|nr:hypothetical protein EDD11_003085 [Mortierella claussenii]
MTAQPHQYLRQQQVRKGCRTAMLIFISLAVLFLFFATAAAQSVPGPQPGAAIAPSVTSGDAGKISPTKTQDSGGNRPMAVTGMGTDGSASARVSVVTTVTVIDGATTTITSMVTPAPVAGNNQLQPAAAATSSLSKAPQSILVVQSTTFGKTLPAAGPVDDQIESHFWDQFVVRPEGGSRTSSGNMIRELSMFMSMSTVWRCMRWTFLLLAGAFNM